jgi:hypothetical protein
MRLVLAKSKKAVHIRLNFTECAPLFCLGARILTPVLRQNRQWKTPEEAETVPANANRITEPARPKFTT